MSKLLTAALWGLCGLLPIRKNRVVFSSFYGKGYSDNPKAVCQALLDSGEDVELLWLTKPGQEVTLPEGVRAVNYHSWRRIWALSTAAVWVDNNRKGALRKRKNQFYLQTWHGFALKRIEKDCIGKLDEGYAEYAIRDAKQTDVMISNSRFMTEIYQRGFWYDGEVMEAGSPRNDLLFADPTQTRTKILQELGLPQNRKLALYAPTFRADHSVQAYSLDAESVRSACQSRFGGEWSVLIRMHPAVESLAPNLFSYDGDKLVNATPIQDITELLAAVHLCITDYSSLMFDFALTGRPCFQFATDIAQYAKDRNFYFPIDETPFPLATDNPALCRNIMAYDAERAKTDWAQFVEKMGIQERGTASKQCAEWILDKIRKGKTL